MRTKLDKLDSLRLIKNETDSLIRSGSQITVLVKLFDNPDLYKVVDGNFPDNIEITYNILRNKSDKIIWVCEIPTIEIGDRFVAFSHYFNEDGITFAFERQSNGYSMSDELNLDLGYIYETKIKYFEDNLNLLNIDCEVLDEDRNKITTNDCDNLEYEYKIMENVDEFLKLKKINFQHKVIDKTTIKKNHEDYNQTGFLFSDLEYYSNLDEEELYSELIQNDFKPSYSDQYVENGENVSIMRYKKQVENGSVILIDRLIRLTPNNQYLKKTVTTKINTTDIKIKDEFLDYIRRDKSFSFFGEQNGEFIYEKLNSYMVYFKDENTPRGTIYTISIIR